MTNQKTPVQGGATEEQIEAAARTLNLNGWTCNQGTDEPGNYDGCRDCREACRDLAQEMLTDALKVTRRSASAPTHPADEHHDAEERPYSEATDIEYGAWDTDSIEEHAQDMLAVVRHRRGLEEREAESEDHAATVTGHHEKLIAEALDEVSLRATADSYYGTETDEEAEAKAQGFNAAMEIVEPYVKQLAALAALAAPVEVDEAKLAEVINDALEAWEGEEASEVFVARAITEWLRGEGQ